MVVDDDKDFLKSIKVLLQDEGFETTVLCNSSRLEQRIKKQRPDLLILDVLMPQRSGFNILEDFKKKDSYRKIPKILLTALDDPVDKMVADGHGVKGYIVKPFQPEVLINKIRACLERS